MTGLVENLLSSIVVLGIGFAVGWRFLRRLDHHFGLKGSISFPLMMLAFYSCLAVVLLHLPHLKHWPLLWRAQGLNGTWFIVRSLFLSACGVAIALCWRTSRSQVMAIALIGSVGFGGCWGLEHYWMSPIYPSLNPSLTLQNVVQQTSESSCAPAALATVLKEWDVNVSEAEVANLAQTSRMGTSMPHLIIAAQKLGMDGIDLEPSWQTIQQINRPGVLSVWVKDGDRQFPHALALLKMSQDGAVVADPASGQAFRVKRQELEAMWRHDYVPIFKKTDVSLSKHQALEYLTNDSKAQRHHKSGWMNARFRGNPLPSKLSRFQAKNKLHRSGKLDTATVLALKGPYIQNEPVLREAHYSMTVTNYHRLES